MCDCINSIEKLVLERIKSSGRYKKEAKMASLREVGFTVVTGSLVPRTYTTAEVVLEGQKKKEEVKVFHNYCPFCGEKRPEKNLRGER